jgi:hypothetical protein
MMRGSRQPYRDVIENHLGPAEMIDEMIKVGEFAP